MRSGLRGVLRRWWAPAAPEPPIRAELFSAERLEQHGESLAAAQPVTSRRFSGRRLAPRLHDNARVLSEAHRTIVRAAQSHRVLTPAAEWLLDNFHVVQEQIRLITNDLPPGYYRLLPKLADGPLKGYPRVFGIAWAVVAHTDSALDMQKLTRFVEAYQRVQPLTIGELWAVAITLRITLVENLRRLAESIAARMAATQLADTIADRIFGTADRDPESASAIQTRLEHIPWSMTFAVQLSQRLRDHDPDTTPALRWLNQRLSAEDTTTDRIVREEVQRQSSANVTVRNIITSMRVISMVNWAEFFEGVNHVDRVLRAGSAFAAMDFPTRDLYRRAVEQLARGSAHDEIAIASRAVAAAQRAALASSPKSPDAGRQSDPGYYLIAGGRRAFEKELGVRAPLGARLSRLSSRLGVISYAGLIGVVSAIVLAAALRAVAHFGAGGGTLLALAVVGLIPATDVAVALVNRFITHLLGAVPLPALELRGGVPLQLRTIVVVPTLLTSVTAVREQIERLEVHHLSNPDANFLFAVLSDWRDSETEQAPDDGALLQEAAAGIARLNAQYAPGGSAARFMVLHRRRVWNAGERKWIGWERKRGKLHELNRLLRGATDTTFMPVDGVAPTLPAGIRYVITLDADTRLPIGAARRLVGKMAHPLNQARFDPVLGLVVRGHGILQPRVTPSLPIGAEGSLYQRVFSGPNGLDPYALAVSDVYQDLFEEGSYTGKGIYDVDVFEAAMDQKIPDDTVLSHDLLEGIFTRAGLVSDVEVVEEFPSRYGVAAARQHRWARGDWQLLPWIFGTGRRPKDSTRATVIPLMGRWKLLDNLRRSLSAPSALLALLVGWLLPMPVATAWTIFILFTIALPTLLPTVMDLIPRRRIPSLRSHFRSLSGDFSLGCMQTAFLVTFLAHQAWVMVDAISRTLFRVFVGRRRLLEWVTAAQVNEESTFDPRLLVTQVLASATFAGLVGIVQYFLGHRTSPIAVPFAALWVLSPFVARWASQPPPSASHLTISTRDATTLRHVARRTWRFFETFVTAEDNMLPPDNFQEDPNPVVAHRTSPTNVGLYLLSTMAARDFGWIGTLDAIERLEAVFATLEKLERFRGHFYNWYETRDLRALEPKYISSVDSGNLAGHLIALSNACGELIAGPIVNPQWAEGLRDPLLLLREALSARTAKSPAVPGGDKLAAALDEFGADLERAPDGPVRITTHLLGLSKRAESILELAREATAGHDSPLDAEIVVWAGALAASVKAHRRDVEVLAPWTDHGTDQLEHDAERAGLCHSTPVLAGLAGHYEALLQALAAHSGPGVDATRRDSLMAALEKSASGGARLIARLTALAALAKKTSAAMEFGFLFDPDRQLLSIGYRSDGTLDSNYYDLLASEARLASFVAIAKGDIPAKHWFRLGRTMTPIDRGSALISWSGSMFEYLMPSLIMRAPVGSLLERTNRRIVSRQEKYGEELGIPWGMSESAYNARDIEKTYQYSAFGVPDLGYKRGLSENTVVAPYATALAAMVDPGAAAANFLRMAVNGARGTYGWYESLDYTHERVPEGRSFVLIRAYLAHHQGMTILAIANAVHDGSMRARFHAEPAVQAAELLLQERMPRDIALARPPPEHTTESVEVGDVSSDTRRRYISPHARVPRTQLLSNGRLTTMVTTAGSGYSRWRDIAITRWREDPTCDNWGSYIFLRDVRSGDIWSAGYQPSGAEPDSYEAVFSEDRVEFTRTDGTITTVLEIIVSPEDNAEIRRVTVTNHGLRERDIELTSYAELALGRQADDVAHPAFAKLFVETEFVRSVGALLATRRRRSGGDPEIWAAHLASIEDESSDVVQFETDRARFLGRGQTIRSATAITEGWPLSNTAGPVLDPIFSLRRRVRLPPGATARVGFATVVAASRDDVLDLADRHRDSATFDRAATLAWTQAQMELRLLGIGSDEAHLFQRLANYVLYSDANLRPTPEAIGEGAGKSSALWAHGISGTLPIVLVRIDDQGDLELVRQLLRAHEYWRLKRLAVDLVIVNERPASYLQELQTALDALIRMNQSMPRIAGAEARGAVYVLRADLVPMEACMRLQSVARAVLRGHRGSLSEQLNRAREQRPAILPPAPVPSTDPAFEEPLPRPELEFANGIGGFADEGREYLTILQGKERTPAPWINVVANPDFGFQVSTEGSGFTWSLNSQQNQLSPWSNDPVSDAPGEVIYVRDDDSGEIWGPTALPIREHFASYSARHGQGYSRFEHTSHDIVLDLLQYVPLRDPVKISRLRIVNPSSRARRLSITAYVEWVLGPNRTATAPFLLTEIDPVTNAIFARNPSSDEFGERVAFLDLNGQQTGWTCDRTEYIGRNGTLDRPQGLAPGVRLANHAGAGIDPCGVLQMQVSLEAEGATEVVVLLGQAASSTAAQALVEKYRHADLDAVLSEVTRQWDDTLGRVQVKTPDRSLDVLVNRWLPYQTLACRIWARTGFYQASGAYGFRDQLQDVLALCVSRPDVAREHVLRAAARQFVEGDVQHWWLPESGRGIRTRVSDDRVWLAYAVAHYVQATGDAAILDEVVPYLDGPVLRDDERDAFFQPTTSSTQASLFDHCELALQKSLATGPHGLPLMGTGDWNDGMDQVGAGGRGESVWLGWFLHATLMAFASLSELRGLPERASDWRKQAARLRVTIEQQAWDGDWYRRAYFDDGTPLGSVSDSACRIDSIAQSWAVISGGAEGARAARAMAAVDKYLMRREERLLLLFTPPFNQPARDPGYIKGYPPGIRENGGQYTHAAAWVAQALTMQGEGDRAHELLRMLNPINHSSSSTGMQRYKVEPYAVCADVYSTPPHVGRGGWTWYTGSAAWLYRVTLERLLGFRVQGNMLLIDPCIPRDWPGFSIVFRYRTTQYDISVGNPLSVCRGVLATRLDGEMLSRSSKSQIPLQDDGAIHRVQVVMG